MPNAAQNLPFARWEFAVVAVAVALSLALGFANLGKPSLWHDEAVQVLVSKSIVETGKPLLPSGEPHPVAPVFNAVMAGFIALFGDSEAVVRTPAVLLGGLNVLLTYVLFRSLLGRPTALVAAFALSLSPWSVAWSRQARFYAMHQTLYIATLWAVWNVTASQGPKAAIGYAIGSGVAYLLALGTSLHSVLFVAPVGAYALVMLLYERRLRSRWTVICLAAGLTGLATLVVLLRSLPEADAKAVFVESGIGLNLLDPEQPPVFYYLSWLSGNLSRGYFILAMFGFGLMLAHAGRRGLFAALGFWAPILVLTFFIAYRRHRFMYFAFPFYVAAFSYGIVELTRFVCTARRARLRMAMAVVVIAFGVRLGLSTVRLAGDSIAVACGERITLATRHPQWRKPCQYVRDRLDDDIAVITTTYMPVLYYVGRVDNWYPSRFVCWEWWETGMDGLKTTADLDAFMAEHPKGFFIAEWFRFTHFEVLQEDVAWVNANMTHIEEGSHDDIILYAWGMDKLL